MQLKNTALETILIVVALAYQPVVQAGDATRVWGVGSKIKQQLIDSATFRAIAGGNAAARFGGDLRSISNTTIGSQNIISIQGNNNRSKAPAVPVPVGAFARHGPGGRRIAMTYCPNLKCERYIKITNAGMQNA